MVKVGEEVINLIEEGYSLNEISRKTGLGKSTIYYHYKKIKGKKYSEVKINFENESELGEFLGIFAGDGYSYNDEHGHYTIRIFVGHYELGYALYLYNKLVKWFDKNPKVYFVKIEGKVSVILFHYSSKSIYLLLKEYLAWEGKKTYTVRLKNFDLNKNNFNLGFVRGLIDTDGNFYAPKRSLNFSTVSPCLASQFYAIFKANLNLEPKFHVFSKYGRADLYSLFLYGVNAQFASSILNFGNPSKVYREALPTRFELVSQAKSKALKPACREARILDH